MPFYRVDLHSHCQGDPVDVHLRHTIFEHIDQAKRVGLDAIAITWHRKVCANPEAFAYAREKGVLLIPGMEIDVEGRHLLVLNVREDDIPGEATWAEVKSLRSRKPEVLVIAPHPFYPHPTCLGHEITAHADCIDAVEWCSLHVKWLPSGVNPNLRAERWARAQGKTVVACSDSHTLTTIGRNPSTIEADALTAEALIAAIRAGRVTFQRQSLKMVTVIRETTKVVTSQHRYLLRLVKGRH